MIVLRLTLKAKWFDMIESGEKKEEYRENKPYWDKRFIGKHYTHILFRNSYSKNARSLLIGCPWIDIGRGLTQWGAPEEDVYILRLGEIVERFDGVRA